MSRTFRTEPPPGCAPSTGDFVRALGMSESWRSEILTTPMNFDVAAWRYLARCAGCDPDLFFPTGHNGPALRQRKLAKAVCAQCPVQPECLQWALDTRQTYGVWGGLDTQERGQLLADKARG